MHEQQPLIDALLPFFQGEQFDEQFESWTQHLNRNQQFLLKMELNRLHTRCVRRLDLRGRVAAPCVEYAHQSQSHHLDELAIEEFEQQLHLYGGHYTEGVYEAVIRAVQQRQADLATEAQEASAEASIGMLDFADNDGRNSDRFYISQPVTIELSNGRRYSATAVDLSTGGARVRVPAHLKLLPSETVSLHVSGWPIHGTFVVRGTENRERSKLVRLCLTDPNQAFISQVKDYLAHRRNRQGLDVEFACQLTLKKALQFTALHTLPHLPLYICRGPEGPAPRYFLETEGNRAVSKAFQWDKAQHLGCLLPPQRLQRLMAAGPVDDVLLTFRIKRGNYHHGYAALASELEADGLLDLFVHFGSKLNSWQLYHLSAWPVSAWQAERAAPAAEVQQLGFKLTDELARQLDGLSHIVQLTPVPYPVCQGYRSHYQSSLNPNALNRYWLGKPTPVTAASIQPSDKRGEPRFRHQTEVALSWQGKKQTGVMRDFSTQGMQLILEHPLGCAVGDQIQVKLPQMQKLTRQLKLAQLPYKVRFVGKGGTVLGLAIDKQHKPHPGEHFFSQLIAQHREKLKTQPTRKELSRLAEALANIYASSMPHLLGFLHRRGNGIDMTRLAIAEQIPAELGPLETPTRGLCKRPHWLNAELLQKHLGATYRKLQVRQRPQTLMLRDSPGRLSFSPATQQADVPAGARELQVTLTPPVPLDAVIAKELAFIGSHALHRAKALETELDDLVAVVDFLPNRKERVLRPRPTLVEQPVH